MDEKKMAEEFAKIWKAVGENSGAIIETTKDLKKLAGCQTSFITTIVILIFLTIMSI